MTMFWAAATARKPRERIVAKNFILKAMLEF